MLSGVRRRPAFWLGVAAAMAAVAGFGLVQHSYTLRTIATETRLRLWVKTIRDVPYGPYPENRLDIMRPRWGAGTPQPAVLVFHGGGWLFGDRDLMRDRVCRRYLAHGFVVANAEYRRGVGPAAEDALRALEWLFEAAPSYGADRRRIVVTGESAGAHLALLAAFQSRPSPAAVVSFYGISDLTALLEKKFIRDVLPEEGAVSQARRLSPIAYVRPGVPPVLSLHGGADSMAPPDQAIRLDRRIREVGGEASEFIIGGAGHGFTEPQLEAAYGVVFGFLARHRICLR